MQTQIEKLHRTGQLIEMDSGERTKTAALRPAAATGKKTE